MAAWRAQISRFLRDDSAATAIEYGIIAAFMGAMMIVAFQIFGTSLTGLFGYVSDTAGNAMAGPN